MKHNVNQISEFLIRYKNLLEKLHDVRATYAKKQFEYLFKKYKPLKQKIEEREKNEGSRFNIFDILNIKYAETRTHTPLLANLLDPKGTHAQGGLFIKNFIENLVPQSKIEYFLLEDANYFDVIEEKVFPDGRIDLFIRSLHPTKKFAIVIENKIYASDQPNQLSRYFNYLNKQLGYPNSRIMIFYLTVKGVEPTTKSISETKRADLRKDQVLKNISYRIDIKKWLKRCYGKVKATNVQELIKQYLDNIDKM